MNPRVRAVEAYLKALRTGEASATATAARHLAPDVVLDTVGAHMWGNGHEEFDGVRRHPQHDHRHRGDDRGVSDRAMDQPDARRRHGQRSRPIWAAGCSRSVNLTFTFNAQDQITRIEQVNKGGSPPAPTDRIPDFVKAIVNGGAGEQHAAHRRLHRRERRPGPVAARQHPGLQRHPIEHLGAPRQRRHGQRAAEEPAR